MTPACAWMEWTLYRIETTRTARSRVDVGRTEACADGIDVIEPEPGEYWLEITGIDEDDEPIWQANCPEDDDQSLTVLRFDVAYACDIEAP